VDHAAGDFFHPQGAFAAGGALAAGLVLVEGVDVGEGLDHVDGIVHDDDAAGAAHGADHGERVEVHGNVLDAPIVFDAGAGLALEAFAEAEDFRGRAAGDDGLEGATGQRSAADDVEQLAHGDGAGGALVVAGALHVAGDAEDAGAGVVGRADLGVGLAADVHDVLHVAEGLDVVDDGRALVEAEHRREVGRLDAGVGAFAFEGLDEAGLLATDVGAGAAVNVDLAAVTGAENVLADEALGLRLGDGFFKDTGAFGHLAADVDVGLLHVVGEARDHGALDQLVRILVHDVAVFERAGLGFVGVDDEVDGLAAFAINERPLEAAREAGAAAAAQAGFFDLF